MLWRGAFARREAVHNAGSSNHIGASKRDSFRSRPDKSARAEMHCTIDWLPASGMAFSAETSSGHLLVMDGAPDGGGRNLAPRPMETVLAGAGGCTAYDVVLILKRGRQDVRGCQVKVTSERASTDPKVFTSIHLHFVVTGQALSEGAVERAVKLSHEKYCSATIMLGKTAEVTTSFEVRSIAA
jgi:putative redox protein